MTRPAIIAGGKPAPITPPDHPNWTGRAHRSMRDAFGYSGDWEGYDNRPPTFGEICAIAFCAAAIVGFVFIGSVVFA